MSNNRSLLVKSKENYDAAIILHGQNKYNASVHCSYYSVFILLKYILCNCDKPIPLDKQNDSTGGFSHEQIIEEVKNRVPSPSNARQIKTKIQVLKTKRHAADYEDTMFDSADCLDAKQDADTCLKTIKSTFEEIWNLSDIKLFFGSI